MTDPKTIEARDTIVLDAMTWTRQAGALLLTYFRKPGLETHTKLNEADIVTAADKASEALLLGNIRSHYPHHSVLSEESGEAAGSGSPWRWVIDPLDGTTNFRSGLPAFCVSVAVEYEGEAVAGFVFAPYLNEFFHAVKGEGAFLNGEPVRCSSNALIERAVVSTGFPVDRATNPDDNTGNLLRVLPKVRGLRRLGTAALEIAYVGAGFLDAHWELALHPWDVAAGMLIAAEGGALTKHLRADRGVSVLTAAPGVFAPIESLLI